MSTGKLIAAFLVICSRGLANRLLWDRALCSPDADQSMPEGPTEDIGRFPWMGVIQHSFLIGDQIRFAVTTGILIHPTHVIAPAEDIAKIPPDSLMNTTKFILWYNGTIKHVLDVLDYTLHPEFSQGNTMASLALLEVDSRGVVGVSDVTTPILPVCLNLEGAATMTGMYAVKMTDIKGELSKEVFNMVFVVDKDCDEFYFRAKLSYPKMKPTRYLCAASDRLREACVWDGGVALITRQSWGYWKLLGFSARGPGCGAPARFIFIANYLQWIDDVISLADVMEEDGGEDLHKIYFRRLSPIKIQMYKGGTLIPKQQGQCDRKLRGRVLFKDSSELLVNKNFVQGFYFVSVMQIAQFACATVDVEAMARTNAAVWLEHHCQREGTGLAPGMTQGPDYNRLECFQYFKTSAFVEFRFFFSFKVNIELALYGKEDLPHFVGNPFQTTITTEDWTPTNDLLRWGSFNPYYMSWWKM